MTHHADKDAIEVEADAIVRAVIDAIPVISIPVGDAFREVTIRRVARLVKPMLEQVVRAHGGEL